MNRTVIKGIKEQDYPALYRAADMASLDAQRRHLRTVRVYLFLLITAAGLSVYGIQETNAAIAAAIVIICSIVISIFMCTQKDEEVWYRARAVAESVKTTTWRFMMQAEPFLNEDDIQIVKSNFRQRIMSILEEHRDLAHALGGNLSKEEQITDTMCNIRNMSLEGRITFYREYRIDEQRRWYAKKSAENKNKGQWWFSILIFCQIIAIIFIVFRVTYPGWPYWPSEVFVVGASIALTWIQVKRFREIASAYGLTAHELGVIRGGLEDVNNEQNFNQFIIDSENAFSREHTQWLARKNVI